VRVLGISAFYHDSAAALVEDGHIAAAAQEERFSRKKHDSRFPRHAIAYCLDAAGVSLGEVDHIVFYDKPLPKFERLLETYLAFAPRGFQSFRLALPLWLKEKLFLKKLIVDELRAVAPARTAESRLLFAEHHQSHAASAFFVSPFEQAVVLTMDGVGEWATTSVALGSGNDLEIVKELHFPHSLGLLYSAFTYYIGFRVNSGEYKVMGLAPYGTPRYASAILEHVVDLKSDGSFRLDQRYFNYCTGLTMTSPRLEQLLGGPVRAPDAPLTQRHMDLAASIQAVTDEIVLRLTRSLAHETGMKNLCLAGGVALNCVTNGKVLRDGRFEKVWIQPAAGDAGGALGAALAAYHQHCRQPRVTRAAHDDGMAGSYLGPAFTDDEAAAALTRAGARFVLLTDDALVDRAATDLADGKALGWFQGRMEFGPRALGNRSILADPRSPTMQSTLNLKIKYRESFRPFAPAVLSEHAADWFALDVDSPYMLFVAEVAGAHRRTLESASQAASGLEALNVERSDIPAVTHVDYSARIQTVHERTNPRFHALLAAFQQRTGCPVLVNTSFNVRGEPIACTPEDAFRCFMGCELDALAVGNLYLEKTNQDPALKRDTRGSFDPD
jgi:carbamoyltransferase